MGKEVKVQFNIDLKDFVLSFGTIIKELKRQGKKIIITMHRYLDGDAFGSSVALGLILRKLSIDSTLICIPFVPEKFLFLGTLSNLHILDLEVMGVRRTERGQREREVLQDYFSNKIMGYGALTILDCAGFEHIPEEVWSIAGKLPYKINIDHHVGYTLDGPAHSTLNLVGNCSSTSEVLFHLMKELGTELDPETAVPLYVGINSDLRKNDILKDSSKYPKEVIKKLNMQIRAVDEETQNSIKNTFSLDLWEEQLLKMTTDSIRSVNHIAHVKFDSHMVYKAKQVTNSLHIQKMPFHEFHVRLRQYLRRYRKEFKIIVIFDQILGKVSLYNLDLDDKFDLAGISKELGNGGGHMNRAGFSFQAAKENLISANHVETDVSDDRIMEKIVIFINKRLSQMAFDELTN